MPTNQKDVSTKLEDEENKRAPDIEHKRRGCVGGGASTVVLCLARHNWRHSGRGPRNSSWV